MKRRHLPPPYHLPTRAVVAFAVTVFLALVATGMALLPDSAADAADALAFMPKGLELLVPAGLFN